MFAEKPAAKPAKKPTGYLFPFDVAASRAAWEKVKGIKGQAERVRRLREILPNDPDPWSAVVERDEENVYIVVTNKSKQTRSIARLPARIEHRTAGSSSSAGIRRP